MGTDVEQTKKKKKKKKKKHVPTEIVINAVNTTEGIKLKAIQQCVHVH